MNKKNHTRRSFIKTSSGVALTFGAGIAVSQRARASNSTGCNATGACTGGYGGASVCAAYDEYDMPCEMVCNGEVPISCGSGVSDEQACIATGACNGPASATVCAAKWKHSDVPCEMVCTGTPGIPVACQ